jgi:hypothetical protein
MGTVTNSNNRLTDSDTTTGFASDGGGGAGPQNEPDFGYQLTSGSNWCSSRKVGTTKGGLAYTHGSTVDMTAEANQVVMLKGTWTNSINAAAYPSCMHRVGNSSTNNHEYAIIDDGGQGDLDPDPKRLTRVTPVDPNVLAWPDIVNGTVTLTTIDFFGIQGDFGGSAKAENVGIDAIDLVRGVGVLWITGSASDFDDFVTHDEGTVANRFGHWSTVRPGVLETFGKSWIGRTETPTATSTQFADSAKTILYGAGFFDAGWTGIGVDLGNASTTVDLADIVFKGQGQNGYKAYFDTITEVDPTPDEVTLGRNPVFITGTPVVYNNDGGTDSIGLTSGTTYWLEYVTDTTYNVHSSRNNARTAATPIALSDGSTGESHWFQRTPDIRPDLEITGTSGTFDATRCTFDSWREFTLTTASTFTSCIFRGCQLVDLTTNNGGVLDACSFTAQTTEPGEALLQTNTLDNLDGCSFTLDTAIPARERGHAIEIDTTSTGETLTDVTFTGYWSSPDNGKGAEFLTTTHVSTLSDIITVGIGHGFASGDEVWYNKSGGTQNIGLTDGSRYYVDVVSTSTIALFRSRQTALIGIPGARINLTAGGSETHTFYSGNAAIVNTSGGNVVIDVTGGNAPSVRNVGAATTTVNISVPLEINGASEGARLTMVGSGGAEDGVILLEGYADSTGKVTGSFSGTTPQSVIVRARHAGMVAAVIQDDGGVFTDYTSAARDQADGTGSADDVLLLPATISVGDATYIAGLNEFGNIDVEVSTAGDTYVGVWEYWNGAWTTLTLTADPTNDFQTSGWGRIKFDKPSDWATTTINTQGPFYYVRFRVTTGGGTQPKAEEMNLGDTVKYTSPPGAGTIAAGTGLTNTVVWLVDSINP